VLSALLVALSVAPPTSVWVVDRRSDDPRCTGEALARAIRTLLPDADVRVGPPAETTTGRQVALTESPAGFTLAVSGGPAPFTRTLPENGAGQCADAVNLSALIVSRDVDELPWRPSAPPPLTAPPAAVAAEVKQPAQASSIGLATDVGFVATKIAGGISPGLTLDLGLRAGIVFVLLGGDLLLAQHPPIAGTSGSYVVQSDPLRAVGGVSLRLGPGDASFALGGGALMTSVAVRAEGLFQSRSSFAAEPFACFWVGYGLRLPWQLSLALRYEERWVPSPTQFFVFGTPSTVQTPTFAGGLSLLIGREFF
jgi:hypothetical protein